jgi:hypothetical protein
MAERELGSPRYVVGADCRFEVWGGPDLGWIRVRGVKAVYPLVDLSDPANPTLGRIEMSEMPVVPDTPAPAPAPPAEPEA